MNIDFKIEYKDLMERFSKLKFSVQNKTIESALKKSGRLIANKARSNFEQVMKHQSKTNYQGAGYSVTRIKNIAKNGIGVKVKLTGKNAYKYRWINWGTNERVTRKGRSTGKIQKTNFFYKAVEQLAPQIEKNVEQDIIKQIEKVMKKNNL